MITVSQKYKRILIVLSFVFVLAIGVYVLYQANLDFEAKKQDLLDQINSVEQSVMTQQQVVESTGSVEDRVVVSLEAVEKTEDVVNRILKNQERQTEIFIGLDNPKSDYTEDEYYPVLIELYDELAVYFGENPSHYMAWFTPNYEDESSMVYSYHYYLGKEVDDSVVPVLIEYSHDDDVLFYCFGKFNAVEEKFDSFAIYWCGNAGEHSLVTESENYEDSNVKSDVEFMNDINALMDTLSVPEEYANYEDSEEYLEMAENNYNARESLKRALEESESGSDDEADIDVELGR